MNNNWTKLTAVAATLLLIVGLTAMLLDQSTQFAYALEQTIEANREIRYCHIRIDPHGNGLSEAWAQFNEDGELLLLRMTFPNTMDGPKQVVWQDGKAEVWFEAKQSVGIFHDPKMIAHFRDMLALFDPKVAIEKLSAAEVEGLVTIETREPATAGDPIFMVVTFRDNPSRREIYHVNAETKLVQQIEKCELKGDTYVAVSRHEYLDYNRPIDPAVFVLTPPADVIRVDRTTQEIGLAKGDLSDEEISVKVVREFFEALIAKDYAKAGRLLGGMPEAKMEECFGKIIVVRIISIGQPTPQPISGVGGTRVPCTVEVEVDGKLHEWEKNAAVRPVHGQPDRWNIHGGI